MSGWQGPRTPHDPVLSRKHHKAVRRYWVRMVNTYGLPCSVCGRALVTDKSQYKIMFNGRMVINDRYLVVGHIEARSIAYSMGKTVDQTETIEATRPECWRCSKSSGAKLGNLRQRTATSYRATSTQVATGTPTPATSPPPFVSRW